MFNVNIGGQFVRTLDNSKTLLGQAHTWPHINSLAQKSQSILRGIITEGRRAFISQNSY